MKSEKGVTLTSLAIYLIMVLIILGILATVTTNIGIGIKNINSEGTSNIEIDKFNIYFLKEVKKQGNGIHSISESEIVFTTNNKYTFKENSIYLNDNIKIAENIEKCEFTEELVNEKVVITVNVKAKNSEQRSIEYVLNNEMYLSTYEDENIYTYQDNIE